MKKENIEKNQSANELWHFKHSLALLLKDMATKWGLHFDAEPPLIALYSKDFGVDYEFTILTSPRAGKFNIEVTEGTLKKPTTNMFKMAMSGLFHIEKLDPITVTDKSAEGVETTIAYEPGALLWDRKISAKKFYKGIDEIHQAAEKRGLYDSETGIRKKDEKKKPVPLPKISVKEAFKEKGTVNPVFLGQKPEDILALYDKPEQLVVKENPFFPGHFVIAHKKDIEYLDTRAAVTMGILEDKGYSAENILKKLESLSAPETVNLFNEVNQEIERRMKKDKK